MRYLFLLLGAWAFFQAAEAQDATPGSQWLTNNNRLDGERYSPLKAITPANASQLGEVCRVQVDGPTTFHAGLVVVDGVIYTNTARETLAIDATTCAVRWKHTYIPDEDRSSPSSRGLAVLDGRVFRGTGDARLIALDAATGKLLWKTVMGAPRIGESATGVPLAWGGVVYMGISGSELGARGRVMAFDAQTGRELWRFNTIPMGKETGAETWKRPKTAKTGGGGVWGSMSLDVATGELFVPVGNAWPDIDKAYRPGANLFTDSMVVLDARTGALKWWHQVTPEDWEDKDLVAAPVIYRDGQARDLMVFAGKDGFVRAIDRDSHQEVFHTPVTTVVSRPNTPTTAGIRSCPGYAGGVEWNGPALDRVNNLLITGAVDVCFIVKLGPTKYSATVANFGGTVQPDGPATGWVTAIDWETGEVRWKYHTEKPVVAGVTPTAGGITLTGDLAGNLLVFDSKTGNVLKQIQTGGALAGGVVTYETHGKQFVAVSSGNVSRNAFGALGVPSVVVMAIGGASAATSGPAGASGSAAAGSLTAAASDPATTITASSSAGRRYSYVAGSAEANPTAPSAANTAAAAGASTRTASNAASAGAPNSAAGHKLYDQVCSTCHGPDGNLVDGHDLHTLKSRRDRAATVSFIKDPKPPMPKLYPDLLGEQAIQDVTAYLFDDLAH